MAKRDYYEVLGISKNSDISEIKKAFRTMAKKYHPDVNKEPDAEAKFKEVNEAYEVLSDPEKRAHYDRFGHQDPRQQASGFGGFNGGFADFGDIFGEFFGGGFGSSGGGSSFHHEEQRADNNVYASVVISFMESIKGTEKKVSFRRTKSCSKCNGSGGATPNDVRTCSTCKGMGRVRTDKRTFFGVVQTESICPTCHGSKKVITNKCSQCKGSGEEKESVSLTIVIPKGIENGERLVVSNRGNQTPYGTGNLYVEIVVKQSRYFERSGLDLYTALYVDPIQAILGGDVEVVTPWGRTFVNIPAGVEHDARIKVPKYGIKKEQKNNLLNQLKEGNLFVIIKFAKPDYSSNELKKLAEINNKNNRYIKEYNSKVEKDIKE